jgi:hypothetical protein
MACVSGEVFDYCATGYMSVGGSVFVYLFCLL